MKQSDSTPHDYHQCPGSGSVTKKPCEDNGNVVKISARRQRTQFSVEQLEILESVFVETHYPDNKLRKRIAKDTGLADERIQVWFQNRRSKYRKKEKRSQTTQSSLKPEMFNCVTSQGTIHWMNSGCAIAQQNDYLYQYYDSNPVANSVSLTAYSNNAIKSSIEKM